MHSVSNLGARKFGREDLPTIGFATRRILRGIEITSTRIRSSADWSREQLNIVAALRFQATSWTRGPERARLQSCPSRNLRGCEFLVGGAGGDCGKGTTFSRAVRAPLSFCHSEELQFRGICFAASPDREQGFPRRLPPARDDERRSSIGTSKLVPFPKSARM